MEQNIRTVFVEANDLKFEVNTCGVGEKLAICLHGFPEHAFCWRYQQPFLAGLGYTVLGRIYGDTDVPADRKRSTITGRNSPVIGFSRPSN